MTPEFYRLSAALFLIGAAFTWGLHLGLSHNPTCLKPHVGEEYKRFIDYLLKTLSDKTRSNGQLSNDVSCILHNAKELKDRIERERV